MKYYSLFATNIFSLGLLYGISILVKKTSINMALQTIPFLFYGLCVYMIYAFCMFVFLSFITFQKNTNIGPGFLANLGFHFLITFIVLPLIYYVLYDFFLFQIALAIFAENQVALESLGMDFNSFFNLFMKAPDAPSPAYSNFGDHTIVGGTRENGTKYVCTSIVRVLDDVFGTDTASRWVAEKAKDAMGVPDFKCLEYEPKK